MTDDRSLAKPEAWWGVIQGAAREHATTSDIWGAIRDYAAERNLAIPSDMFSQVNRMRSLASGLTRASVELGRAGDGDVITGGMVGQQIYSRASAELRQISELYHVRFEMVTRTMEGESSGWYTLDYGGSLPATVGELRDDINAYAEGLTDSYGVTFVGLGDIEVGGY